MKNILTVIYFFFVVVFFISSCANNSKPLDTATSGEITISVDETFYPVMDSQVSTFNSLYKYAKVNARYTSENQAFQDLLHDSARIIIVSRELREEEKKYFEQIKITPRTTKVAIDALALFVNKENTDTNLSFLQMQEIFSGKISQWKEINPKSKLSDIQIIFDNGKSSTVRYMQENIINKNVLPKNCFAVKTNPEVVEYVSKNKNAIGIIGVNWISDGNDPKSLGFLNKINVIGVEPPDTSKIEKDFYKPYQAYMAQKSYPLLRDIYIISREARTGLGTGFSSFVASDKGQRIILKSGLLPATMPVRIVQFH